MLKELKNENIILEYYEEWKINWLIQLTCAVILFTVEKKQTDKFLMLIKDFERRLLYWNLL